MQVRVSYTIIECELGINLTKQFENGGHDKV